MAEVTTGGMKKTPPCLARVVAAARRNPYESFASAAVAHAFHPEDCEKCKRLEEEAPDA